MESDFFMFPADLNTIFDSSHILSSHSLLGKKQNLHPKSQDQERKVQNDLKCWHVFVDQINIISGRIPGFKLIVPGTTCAASYVIYQGFWGIPVLIAKDSGTVSYINILQICKVLFIKITDSLKNFLTVNGSACT